MCQKAVAGPFISLADIRHEDFAWTRGKPASFRSSTIAERDFCAACGTPLSYRQIGGPHIELTTGSFDQPERVVADLCDGHGIKLSWSQFDRKFAEPHHRRLANAEKRHASSAISIRTMTPEWGRYRLTSLAYDAGAARGQMG